MNQGHQPRQALLALERPDETGTDEKGTVPFLQGDSPLFVRPRFFRTLLACGLIPLSLLACGCGRHGKAAPVGGSDVPPSKVNLKRNVELARPEQRALVYEVETVGAIEAEGQTEIAAGVRGVVDEVNFREGDYVSADTVLAKVDQRSYESAARLAEANLARAEARVELAKDLERRTSRAGQGASAEEKAKASLGLSEARADLESARASLDIARNNLDRSRVRAPYSGHINQRKVTRGSYLEDKTVIATMADLSRLRLVGWVPETATGMVRELMQHQDARAAAYRKTLPLGGFGSGSIPWAGLAGALLVQKDQEANEAIGSVGKEAGPRFRLPSGFDPEFTLLAYPHRTFRARIFYLSTVASPDTHMFECKAEIDVHGLGVELRPGYTARIRLPLRSNSHACVVPEESVRASERGFIAFVPVERVGRDGKPEWVAQARTLELGFRSPGWVEVRQGLDPHALIVRRGAEALEDGTPLRIVGGP